MTSIQADPEQVAVNPRLKRSGRLLRWPALVATLAVLVSACGIFPSQTVELTGTSTSGSAASLASNDDVYYSVGASCGGGFGSCHTDWIAQFTLGSQQSGTGLSVYYAGKNAGAGYQSMYVWSWPAWDWVPIATLDIVGTSEVNINRQIPGNISTYLTTHGVAFIRVETIGNFTSTSADLLEAGS